MCVLVGVGAHERARVKGYYRLLLQPMDTIRDIWWDAPSNPEPSPMSLRQSEHNPVDPSLTVPQSAYIHVDFHDEKTETSTCPLNLEFITCGSAQCLHAVQL